MKKTNRTFKRFAAITSASLLAACALMPAVSFADDDPTTIKVTINSSVDTDNYDADKATHTYTAYPIFAGSYNNTNGLTINSWGAGFNSDGLLSDDVFKALIVEPAVAEDTANGITAKAAVTFADYIAEKEDTAAVTAQAIEKMISINSITADGLADILAKYVSSSGTPIVSGTTELPQGYYLVKDTYNVGTGTTVTNDALSKFILEVSGSTDIVITPKKSYPTVIKKVKEDNSNNTISDYPTGASALENAVDHTAGWNDVGDFCIGEEIDFMLYGSVPATIDDYTNGYKYVFKDKMSTNLEYIDANADNKPDVTVYIGETVVRATDYTVSEIADNSFSVTFNNLKGIKDENGNDITVTGSSIVKVAYKAKLTASATPGINGETNEVYLEYSNNPEWKDDGNDTTVDNTTDRTTTDKVVVFTYQLDVNKIDGATKEMLKNATFQLYKTVTETENGSEVTNRYYAKANNGVFVEWVKATKDGNNYTAPEGATTFTSGDTGTFSIKGIDEGSYFLTEITPPTGYNALGSDVAITITATTSNTQGEDADGTELTALNLTSGSINYSATETDKFGKVKIDIANNKGNTLPGTGGIGTTIFYLGGGAMAAIGGIYLISKRRMKKSEE